MGDNTYILVWVDEEDRWYYFINDFFEGLFEEGYVVYEIDVEDGVIVADEVDDDNIGKSFVECYDLYLWE